MASQPVAASARACVRGTGLALPSSRFRKLRSRRLTVKAFDAGILSGALDAAANAAHHLPLAYERVVYPCSTMNCGDVVYRSTLDPVLRMEEDGINPVVWVLIAASLWYLTTQPGVLQGFWDAYVKAPLMANSNKMTRKDVKIGSKLAEGGFGTVYLGEAARNVPGQVRKGDKLVIKKAIEFGEAEVYMNERLMRAAPSAIAPFLTAYTEGPSEQGSPLVLVWRFEGKLTLDEAFRARDFPFNVEQPLLGRELRIQDPIERKLATIKVIVKQILTNLEAMHATGIVHRDIKPQNLLLTDDGVKLIDLGACADLRVGINYVPNEYLLDPRFAPPQQYVMSPLTPRAPPVPLAAFLSPVLWRLNQPDRFDTYSVGIVFLQLAFAPLRSDNNLVAFNKKLESLNYDLEAWREGCTKWGGSQFAEGFELLDAGGGAGWRLAKRMLEYDHYERYSIASALKDPWFSGAAEATSPVAKAGRALSRSVDQTLNSVMDTKAFVNMRESLSEAELYSALADDETAAKEQPPPKGRQTMAWWQERSKAQKAPGGILGKFLDPAAAGKKNARARAGGATMRAMSSVDSEDNFSVSSRESSNGKRGSKNGSKASNGSKGSNGSKASKGSGKRGRQEEAAAPKAAPGGGLRALFGRK